MNSVIKVEHLNIAYDDFIVLQDANFEVNEGEIFTVLGGSGCGKTTLMRQLIGLEKPSSGSIFINGIDITHASANSQKIVHQNMGVMFQSGALLSSLTLLENVLLPLKEHAHLPDDLAIECALLKLRLVQLEKYAHFYPANISGGMVKRAAIARAMALDARIIFLDEPSAGLDPISHAELDKLIADLAHNFNITFVIVTHELATITSIADRAIMLNNKKIVAQGTISHLMHEVDIPFVKEFFNLPDTNKK
ncbi:MAG: ATP-binding cassette domain-containing protein [Pseudomonadota bacterium]